MTAWLAEPMTSAERRRRFPAAATTLPYILVNHTPWRVVLKEPSARPFELAPFERRTVTEDDELNPGDFSVLVARRMVSQQPRHDRLGRAQAVGLLSVAIPLAALLTLVSWGLDQPHWVLKGGIWLVAALYLLTLGWVGARALRRALGGPGGVRSWSRARAAELADRAIKRLSLAAYEGAPTVLRGGIQVVTMAVALILAIVVPAVIVYYGAGVDTKIQLRAAAWPFAGKVDGEVVGRMLQLGILIFAAFLPALMYIQFDRTRLDTLRDRWKRQLFRLDPAIATEADLWAKYGGQMEDAAGRGGGFFHRVNPARRSPIVVTTVILALGWTMVMVDPGTRNFDFLRALNPNVSPISIAFLGAYFFAIQMTVRGYVRGDLQPKSFSIVTSRVVVAVILTWVVQVLLTGDVQAQPITGNVGKTVYALAFVAGVLPDFVLRFILDTVQGWTRRRLSDGSEFAALDGLDLYDRTRLGQEGVTNREALAHHGLVDLMLRTRIPMARLVDWVDQAILAIHVPAFAAGNQDPPLSGDAAPAGDHVLAADPASAGGLAPAGDPAPAGKPAPHADPASHADPAPAAGHPPRARPAAGMASRGAQRPDALFQQFRSAGVRTATDLLDVVDNAATDEERGARRARLLQALSTDEAAAAARLEILARSLRGEEWVPAIQQWHGSILARPAEARLRYIDGEGMLRTVTAAVEHNAPIPVRFDRDPAVDPAPGAVPAPEAVGDASLAVRADQDAAREAAPAPRPAGHAGANGGPHREVTVGSTVVGSPLRGGRQHRPRSGQPPA